MTRPFRFLVDVRVFAHTKQRRAIVVSALQLELTSFQPNDPPTGDQASMQVGLVRNLNSVSNGLRRTLLNFSG